jgi:hypothetical protein
VTIYFSPQLRKSGENIGQFFLVLFCIGAVLVQLSLLYYIISSHVCSTSVREIAKQLYYLLQLNFARSTLVETQTLLEELTQFVVMPSIVRATDVSLHMAKCVTEGNNASLYMVLYSHALGKIHESTLLQCYCYDFVHENVGNPALNTRPII